MAEVVYPNVWSPGQLFAFSGIDGETDWFHPFVATTLPDDLGLLFHLREPRRLWCEPHSHGVEELTPRIVSGDCIEFFVRLTRANSFALRYIFFDRCTVIGETSSQFPPSVGAEGPVVISRGRDVTTHSLKDEHTALVTERYGEKIIFAFSFSPESGECAIGQGREALQASLPGLLQRKLLFYTALGGLAGADERRRRAVAKAVSILRTNVESPQGLIPCRWSTPDRWPHRDMWLWDSCFHSVGYRVFSPELAAEALQAVLAVQREDGFIAHRISPVGMSDITQPPLLAWAFLGLFRLTNQRSLIESAYPQICRFIEWILENRRVADVGLLTWRMSGDEHCRCPESGMGNSLRFDGSVPVLAVDFNAYVVNEMKCLKEMALLLGKHGDAADWKARTDVFSEAVNGLLWDEADGFYYDRTCGGEFVRVKTSSGFLPLFAGVPDKRRAERLLERLRNPDEFLTAFPVPSVARNEPCWEADMWRGPSWLNISLLIIQGLERYNFGGVARELTDRILTGVEHWYARLGSIYEYYDPDGRTPPPQLDRKGRLETGKGIPPISDYSWSAACYLALVTGMP